VRFAWNFPAHAILAYAMQQGSKTNIWQKKQESISCYCVLMKRRLNRQKKLSPKTVDFAAWRWQAAHNNWVRE